MHFNPSLPQEREAKCHARYHQGILTIVLDCFHNHVKPSMPIYSTSIGINNSRKLTLWRLGKEKKSKKQRWQVLHTKLTALKVISLCPLVLPSKVCWRQDSALRSKGGVVVGSGLFECAAKERQRACGLNFVQLKKGKEHSGWILNF